MDMPPKKGQKVLVEAFEGTVGDPNVLNTGSCTEVFDSDGYVHYVFYTRLKDLSPPYEDGKLYIDADCEELVFIAKRQADGEPGWKVYEGYTEYEYGYATRPLRLLGEEISES